MMNSECKTCGLPGFLGFDQCVECISKDRLAEAVIDRSDDVARLMDENQTLKGQLDRARAARDVAQGAWNTADRHRRIYATALRECRIMAREAIDEMLPEAVPLAPAIYQTATDALDAAGSAYDPPCGCDN